MEESEIKSKGQEFWLRGIGKMNDIPCKLPFHLQWEKYVQMIYICFLFTIPYCDRQNSCSAVVTWLQGQILPWDKGSKSEIFGFHKCISLIKNYTSTYLILSRYMEIIFLLCGLYNHLRLFTLYNSHKNIQHGKEIYFCF